MKKNYFYLGAILDRSGSMGGDKILEARNGFNVLVKEKKEQDHEFDMFLTIFDDHIDTLYKGSIDSCPILDDKNFYARGMTSLYDAIGKTVTEIGSILSSKPEEERPEKVIICIITDGAENNSREFNHKKISDMIKEQKTKYSWEFIFMGADEASILNAQSMGINNTVLYDNNSRGVCTAYSMYSKSVDSFTGGNN